MIEQNLFEQLEQIYRSQPVFAGDLIHKQAKDELIKRKWVMYYEDDDLKLKGYIKGVGGYCCTELGKNIYGAMLLTGKYKSLLSEAKQEQQ